MNRGGDRKRALVLGTADTKGEEVEFLAAALASKGLEVEVIDMTPAQWLKPGDDTSSRSRVMEQAAARIAEAVEARVEAGEAGGVIAIGGASGAALASPALQRLPLGFPKVLISPVVSGETTAYIDTSDVVMVPPVVDFAGLNAYAERALETAATTLFALMQQAAPYPDARASTLAVTAFGVTTPLVEMIGRSLKETGVRQAVFSCNGTGGRAYERFIAEGRVFGAFDLTTSELADEMLGGVLAAGPTRLTSASRRGVPQVVLPGAMDFINFGRFETVPEHLRDRPIVRHTPEVTLVRTSADENERLGRLMAERLKAGGGPFTVIVPLKGFSLLSEPGKPFYDPQADEALLEALREELGDDHVLTVDAPINSVEVANEVLRVSEPWRLNRG